MGSYPTEGANAQTRSEQNRMDCRMTLSSVNDEVTQWFSDDYMSTWIGVVSGVIARGTDFILDYWSVPLHYTAGPTAQWLLEATQVIAVSAQTQGRLHEQGFATTTIPDYSVKVYNQAGAAIEAIMSAAGPTEAKLSVRWCISSWRENRWAGASLASSPSAAQRTR